MFTIKVFRKGANGEERTHLYQARSVNVYGGDWRCKPGERCVVWEEESGDSPAIVVSNEPAEISDGYPARLVVIENANGRTTEVVRPMNPVSEDP